MISRVQFHHFYLMTWFKTLQVHWIDRWILQSTDQKSTVYWKVKLWLFGQIQVPKIIIHQNMSKYETYSSRNKKVKISFWKVKISKLRNFSKCWKFHFHNFEQNFHHDARWFKRNFQHESCRSPWNIQLFFTHIIPKVFGYQVIILWICGHETKHLVKFCPNLVRILTQLHGTFSYSSKGNIQNQFK